MARTPDNKPNPHEGDRDPYAVLRNHDFRLYLTGRLLATVGQQMFATALGWELYERTHSALALGFVGLTQVLPMILCTLPAGHIADSYNRQRIIVMMTVIIAVANAGLVTISATSAPIILIYTCLVITGTARTFLWAANASFLPQLVERKYLARAVTWSSSVFQISSIAGPALAGGLLHLTHHAASIYAMNAAAALGASILIGKVHQRQSLPTNREELTFKNLLTGFSFVFSARIILGILTLDMFAVLLGGATALLPIYAKDILLVGPWGLGLLQAALPLGAIVCAFVLAHRPPLQKAGRALLWAVTVFGLATIAFGCSRWFWFSFLMLFTCGAADNVSVVVRHTLVQLLTPNEKRGRVSAVNNLFIGTSNELGEFESGTVAYWFGPAIGKTIAAGAMVAVIAGGVGTILVVLGVAWAWPEIRKYGRLDSA